MERRWGEGGLRIQLLGAFGVWAGSQLIPEIAWRRRKGAALVKLLALAPEHRLHREEVQELLWPGLSTEPADNNLHRTLYIVRHALDPGLPPGHHSPYLCLQGDLLVLCPEAELHVDVDAFLEAARVARQSQDPAQYEQAITLYTGDLLRGDQYEDWAAMRREELRRVYHDLLRQLSRLYEGQGQDRQAIEVLQRFVASEPAEEEAHVQLMRLYALCGLRHRALQQYDRLMAALRREVDAEPDAPARQLVEEIRAGRFPLGSPVAATDTASAGSVIAAEPTAGDAVSAPAEQASKLDADQPASTCPPANLPRHLSSFMGREQEIAEVKRLLSSVRLLTLTGAGGVGKSRLALQVAAEVLEEFGDGVWLVQLAALSDARLVPQTVAGALGVREHPDRPTTEVLVDFLRPKKVLLVFDNCEHLLVACAEFCGALLARCSSLRILASSRQALGISGEIAWRVPSMVVPDPEDPPAFDSLPHYDAVSLFLERTRSTRPDFRLTLDNVPAVVEVCRRLDGIPLAIELAAARMKVLTVEQLAERLDNCFAVLGGGSPSPLPRHRTLRATMDWSHDLLSEPERVLFRRLPVFAGGWTLEAMERVCSGEGIEEPDVLELLSQLVDQSLVIVTEQGASMRYRLLEPVRQYAAQKMVAADEEGELLQRHACWYLKVAEGAELQGKRQTVWFARLGIEHDNLRAALQWAWDREQPEVLCRLAAALWRFWWVRGRLKEGRRWLDLALAAEEGSTVWRVRALEGAGTLARAQLDYTVAGALLEESLQLARQLGDKEGIARGLLALGVIAGQHGEIARAKALFEESLALHRALGNQPHVATALGNLASAAEEEGDKARAIALNQEALEICRRVGDTQLTARYLDTLGRLILDLGDDRQAEALERESLMLRRDLGDRGGISECLEVLAEIAIARLQATRAMRLDGAAEGLRQAIGLPLHPEVRPRHARYLARLRSQLHARQLAEARAKGRVMELEEAITYALSTEEPSTNMTKEAPLTAREGEVAALIAQARTNHEIAGELKMSEPTVAVHVHHILKKLGFASRKDIAGWAREEGLDPRHASQEGQGCRIRPSAGPAAAPPSPHHR